ncbi:D-alanyl-D-alanine carboxypeptidase [Rhodococcoides trifolii]|uniref:D-alanyl-D-alanine carboxypeptidase n=1 Tax=Rhodococcoides trifolii TaxID=908250 RepID=A0A917G582_9NOCA|nr:serine hydrolase [Rhodococcus trifolii]GGG23441.1 D-alanyl-D-alanine carboxypeptidase [Rhodococcus trifolii]
MKRFVAPLAALLVLAGCAAAEDPPAAADPACESTPAVDLTQPEGWIGQIPAQSETTSLVIDDGKGTVVDHRPDAVQPLASAVKVVHLAAYAQAVAAGKLDPNEQVPILDWERWHASGVDGGAHPQALTRLGIPNNGVFPDDLSGTVKLDDMVSAMIQESDNATADYLRYRLGDQALIDAAATGGWADFQVPTLVGSTLGAVDPEHPTGDLWPLAQRFAFDDAFRVAYSGTLVGTTPLSEQAEYLSQNGPMGTASELTSVYRSILSGTFGAATDTIRRQLEWRPAPDGFTAMGFKGGSVPGVLTQAFEFTLDDGSQATAVWLMSGMDESTFTSVLENFGNQQQLIIDAARDRATLDRIACVA